MNIRLYTCLKAIYNEHTGTEIAECIAQIRKEIAEAEEIARLKKEIKERASKLAEIEANPVPKIKEEK